MAISSSLPQDRRAWAEWAAILLVFVLHGAWPVPEVNEPYYLGKAIHFWNPGWVGEDFFLDSSDTHTVFYLSIGWLSLLLPPTAMAWSGRLMVWGLMAWAWQRLSWAVLPRPWWSVLSAALLVCLNERCHMAGEWIVGGVEAKGLAFVAMFLGLEALVRGRWNLVWTLFGLSAMFHVLVGGWAVVAAAFAWLLFAGESFGRKRPEGDTADRAAPSGGEAADDGAVPSLRAMLPGLLLGGLLSLPGLIPSLMLTWNVDSETVRQANIIYVYHRLPHHLDPLSFPEHFVRRFMLLSLLWTVLAWQLRRVAGQRRMAAFVLGSLLLAAVGAAIALFGRGDPGTTAGLLRFYWFRTSDVAVPLAVALGGTARLAVGLRRGSEWGGAPIGELHPAAVRIAGSIALGVAIFHVGGYALLRTQPVVPRADRLPAYGSWKLACRWIADEENVPADARFLTPRLNQTFKWYTARSEVVTMKDIPQDAHSIVAWWARLEDVYGTGSRDPYERWHRCLADVEPQRLRRLGEKYDAQYVLTFVRPPLPMLRVYANRVYAVYQLEGELPAADEQNIPPDHSDERGPGEP